jgi:DNA-binding SARP family transcriptional activator
MIHVHTLGSAAIDAGNSRFTPIATRRFAMLLYLAAEPGKRVSRAQLRDLIFPDGTEGNALHSIRELVYVFRQCGVVLSANRYGIELRPEDVKRDYLDVIMSNQPTADQINAIEGGFLPGYAPEHSEAFSEWLSGYRARTSSELRQTVLKEVARAKQLYDSRTMERAARACLALDPLNEEATFGLAEALAYGGAKTQALMLLEVYAKEVDASGRDLHIPATVLRRRIGERMPTTYPSKLASPFVGRSAQMFELGRQYALAVEGQSQCVALLGEAGIGKSRVAAEFTIFAAVEGAEVASAGCQTNDTHRPFSAFADLAPRLMNMRGALGCAPASVKAIERLTKGSAGEPIPFDEAIRDSEAMCDSIAIALVDLVDAITAEQPLVLVIEDIHWSDRMSTRVIAALLSRRKARRVFVLLTSRERDAINAVSRYADTVSMIELRGLDSDAVDRMTSELAGQSETQLDEELRAWLERTSLGNPLFLESLISHFVATKERFAMSPTLGRLLERRIGMLPPAAVTTLQICALLGKHATVDSIIRATDLPRFELLRAFGELEEARLVVSDEGRVRTAHSLIADVSIAALSPMQARLAHQSVAESLDQEGGASVVWDCAEHWIAAKNVERAIAALRRCAVRALETGRPGDAAEAYSRALALDLSPDERNEIARSMALAADAANDPALVLRALGDLQDPPVGGGHDDFEFLRFRALTRSMLAGPDDVHRILKCATDTNAAADHRVTAATLLLKFADANGDFEFVSHAACALPEGVLARARMSLRLEFLLLRTTLVGDRAAARAAAQDLLYSMDGASAPDRLSSQSNAAVALELIGAHEEAIAASVMVYQGAETLGIVRLCARMAALACHLYLCRRDDVQASLWFERTVSALARPAAAADSVSVTSSALLSAWVLGRADDASEVFLRADRAGVFDGSDHRQWLRRVSSILLRNLGGSFDLDDSELAQFVTGDCGATPSVRGIRSVETAVACQCLFKSGQAERARKIFTDYIATVSDAPLPRYLDDVRLALFESIA